MGLAMLACVSAAHPWAQDRSDASRTQQSPDPGPEIGEVLWKYSLPYQAFGLAASSDGQIYTGPIFDENYWNGEFYMRALRADGSLAWRKKLTPYPWGFSQEAPAVPAIDPNGNVIVASTNSELIKMGSDGTIFWKKSGPDHFPNGVSPAVLRDGTVRWLFGNGVQSYTAAGEFQYDSGMAGATMSVANNGETFMEAIKTYESNTYNSRSYLNADGTLRWAQSARGGGTGRYWPLGNDGKVYSGQKALSVVDGSQVWADPTPIPVIGAAVGKNGRVYGYGTQIRAFDKTTGATLWTTPVGSIVKHIAIDAADRLYATTTTGEVVSLSPAGQELWRVKVADSFVTGPIIGPNGTLLACGKKGTRIFIFCVR